MIVDTVKVIAPAALAFFIGIGITPIVAHYLYKYKAWKKKSVRKTLDGENAPISQKLHDDERRKTPRMGGIVVWFSVAVTVIGFWAASKLFPNELTQKLDFLSRDQTWIPLFTLLAGAFVGLLDDLMDISGKTSHLAGGFSLKKRLLILTAVGLFVGWWFFEKLEVTAISIPFLGPFELGVLFIPFFVLVMISLYAGGVIDGIDGLSGGVFVAMFSAYAVIALQLNQINLAAFAATIVGALLAFLWFNIPPARFFMSETGTMGLTITLAVIAFMTDSLGGGNGVVALPLVAFLLFASAGSSVLQLLSKKFRRGKKIFLVAPLHHHFEAIGWPSYKVVMRYWVLSVIFAILGLIVALIG